MQIACPQCAAQYNVEEARIPPQGVSIKCPRCQHTFVVQSPSAAGAVPLPGSGGGGAVPLPGSGKSAGAVPLPGSGKKGGDAVPLPGTGGAVPLPGTGGAVPLPGAGAPGAVPLPGSGKAAAVPLPGGGGAVPLPGGGGAVPLPGQSAVPLPGQGAGAPAKSSLPSMEEIFGTSSAPAPAPRAATPAPAVPGAKSMSLGDIFGESGGGGNSGSSSVNDSRPPTPFHGTNSVAVDAGSVGGGADIMGMIGEATGQPRDESYQIRKRSGRVLGPLPTSQILTMFHKGELLGSEEASQDGVTWRPLAQIPAFAQVIQQAMASALAGLDNLPVPKGSGMEDLPAPKGGRWDDLPAPRDGNADLPVPHDGLRTGELGVDTGQLRDAELAKDRIQKRRRQRAVNRVVPIMTGAIILAVVVAAGVALNFVTPYGYFGYKIVFPDEVKIEPPKKPIVEAKPEAPKLAEVDLDYDTLLRADTYTSYFQGAEQAKRGVEAGKQVTPFPDNAKKAAAQRARFLGYLIFFEDLPAFIPDLKEALPLADGEEIAKVVGEAAKAYADGQWDAGLAALKPYTANEKSLPPMQKAEMFAWTGLGLEGKGDVDGAIAAYDSALQQTTKSLAALYLQARALAKSGQPDAALTYIDKILAVAEGHPRALILKGTLLAGKSDTREEGKKLLTEMSEGEASKVASPPQVAQAFMGRADIAIAAQQNSDALLYLQKAVDLVPQNRKVRVSAAELALKLRDYQAAQTHTKKLFELAPDDTDGIIMMARAKMGARDALSAYSDLQVATKKWPDNPHLAYWFGVAAREMSKLDEARAQFEKASKLDPKAGAPVVELVYDLIDQGKLSEAVKRATAAEELVNSADRFKVRAAKAYAYARRRQFEQGEKEYKKALEENPRDTDTRARYAGMLIAMRRIEDAERQVNEAALLDAKNPAVIVAAGDVLAARVDYKGALAKYEEAMQLAPNNFQPYLRASIVALELKDVNRAKGFVDTAAQLRPSVAEVLAAQGLVMKTTDPKSAAGTLQLAMEKAPEEPQYPYQLGIVQVSMGAPLEAIDSFHKAVAIDPDFVDAYLHLARVQRDLGRMKDAKQSLEDAVRIDPKRADAWLEIADIAGQANDESGALKAYEKALKADPKNPASVCAMGETLVARMGNEPKNLKRGIDVLENCVALSPKHATAWKTLGTAYKSSQPQKKKDCVRAFKAHIAANPDDIENELLRDYVRECGG